MEQKRRIPTGVLRWLAQDGQSMIVRRATLRALVRLFDFVKTYIVPVRPELTRAETTDVKATVDALERELDEIGAVIERIERIVPGDD